MTHFEIASIYIALNLLLLSILTVRVGLVRMSKKVSLGDNGDQLLRERIRAHGNYTESTPFS